MRIFILIAFLFSGAAHAQEFTTILLVRHAEKDMTASTNDPGLSPEGAERAEALLHAVDAMDIDAVYSTPYIRTRSTVRAIADKKGLDLQEYDPFDEQALHRILHENEGNTILFSGHSNTVPAMLNMLTQSEDYKVLPEGAYDNLYIVVLFGTDAKVIQMKYGEPDH